MVDWIDFDNLGCFATIGVVLLIIALAVGIFFGESLLIMWLWNAVLVAVMEFPALGYWYACGLNLLCHLLFNKVVLKSSKD